MLQTKQIRKLVVISFCLLISVNVSSQNYEIKDTTYFEFSDYILKRDFFIQEKLIKTQLFEISYSWFKTSIIGVKIESYDFLKNGKGFGFRWDNRNGTLILAFYREYLNTYKEVSLDVLLNMNSNDYSTLGSVLSVSSIDGYEKKYQPGEYYYDFPADPDSIFNAIPKELGLPDTLLHIKYKQPWME
jgi:hypothetical protein